MNKYENNRTTNNNKEIAYTNYNIRGFKVRVIESDRTSVMDRDDAIALAKQQKLDLVQISYDKEAKMPVCKIIDYGKFKYEQSKKDKVAKKQARANLVDVKTVQFSITTDDNDKNRLISQAKEFLNAGDKVKMTIRFRNKRESQNIDFAKSVLRSILEEFNGIAVPDSNVVAANKEISCVIRKVK